MRTKILLLLLVQFLFCSLAKAQSPISSVDSVRVAVEKKDWITARNELDKLRQSDPSEFQSKNYDYLLARVAEELHDTANATQHYQSVVAGSSLLSEYALWRLARIARAYGDLVTEREYLRKLIRLSPTSLLVDATSLRMTESFLESKDYQAAASAGRQAASSKNSTIAREASLLVGLALLRDQKLVDARDAFTKLVMQMPDASRPDDFALAAVRQLDELDKRPEIDIPRVAPSEADHLLRASVYQFNRDFVGARLHYQSVIDANPQSGAVPNATYQIGRGLYLEGKYEEAIKRFQTVIDSFGQSSSARDAFGQLAASYLRLKRIDDAINAYKNLINSFPDAPNPERPFLNIIDALHEAGRYSEALSWVQQTRTRFPNQIGSTLALFAKQRIHLAQGAWLDVIRDADELSKLNDLGGTRLSGGTTEPEVAFLKAFALERLNRIDEAISAYLTIPDGRNEYYGMRATRRLLSLADNERTKTLAANLFNYFLNTAKTAQASGQWEKSRSAAQNALRLTSDKGRRNELLTLLRQAYNSLPNYRMDAPAMSNLSFPSEPTDNHQRLGVLLFNLALYDEAIPEIFVARTKAPKAPATGQTSDEDFRLAVYALRGGFANRAVRYAEPYWKNIPADYVLELAPRELVELLYPVPFRESLLKHTSSRNLDPRFVLSIIRQESRYQVDVKSVAAARGMMQFISSTANEIAAQLKLTDFSQDDLYNADTAILFGSQYLANLFQQFPNQPEAVAGSYNGGADNLARWIARSKSTEAERYVPEIGFSQTKDYVYKVMSNYWAYQRFYDAELNPLTK